MQVVVGLEFSQRVQQMGLVPDQHPVQQLVPTGAYSALHDRVHSRHPNPGEHDLDASVGQRFVECGTESSVTVADQGPDDATLKSPRPSPDRSAEDG